MSPVPDYPDTCLDASLIDAYSGTEYRVYGPVPAVLTVNQASVQLQQLHDHYGVNCSAFITACNPYSQRIDDVGNLLRQASLKQEILEKGYPLLEAVGKDPQNKWPREPSFLVLGIPQPVAQELGRLFEQNAILYANDDAVPRLLILR
ncbi:MAG: DUF3293 domain-containing protein [Burkholderiaceae bacterium]